MVSQLAPTGQQPLAGELPLRTRTALATGRVAASVSRRAGLGRGGMIGGRIAYWLDPSSLRRLGQGRTVVLVAGTNGKTTTSLMLSRILAALGPVAANSDGANMPDGVLGALLNQPTAPYAVLEVDENYIPTVSEQVRPACLVLLNLSRDQLDRVGEVRCTERALRAAIARLPGTVVVANCDDPLVTSAALESTNPLWVAAGQTWRDDSTSCARCGQAIRHEGSRWRCGCGLERPAPNWTLDGGTLTASDGTSLPLDLRLPGRANAANAAIAVAAAECFGVSPTFAASRLREITNVAGRYRQVEVSGRTVRVLLAKNPAGWQETLGMLHPDNPVVIAANSREADGRDTSWLWDVPFERLRGRQVVAAGERASDVGVRLTYAEVPHALEPDPIEAVRRLDPGEVDLVANYTAFRNISGRLDRD